MLGALFTVIRSKDPHGPTADLFRSRVRGYFKVWDDYLGERKYCAGGELTIADLSLYAGYARAKGAVPGDLRRPAQPGALGEGAGRAAGHSAGHQVLSARQGLS